MRDTGSLGEAHPGQVDPLGWPVLTGRYVGSFSSILCCGVFFQAVHLNDGGEAPNASRYKYSRAELGISTMQSRICQRRLTLSPACRVDLRIWGMAAAPGEVRHVDRLVLRPTRQYFLLNMHVVSSATVPSSKRRQDWFHWGLMVREPRQPRPGACSPSAYLFTLTCVTFPGAGTAKAEFYLGLNAD